MEFSDSVRNFMSNISVSTFVVSPHEGWEVRAQRGALSQPGPTAWVDAYLATVLKNQDCPALKIVGR